MFHRMLDLIKQIGSWVGRWFGELNFWVTQFLTGHRYFDRTSIDVIERRCELLILLLVFVCRTWNEESGRCLLITGPLDPDTIIQCMLAAKSKYEVL